MSLIFYVCVWYETRYIAADFLVYIYLEMQALVAVNLMLGAIQKLRTLLRGKGYLKQAYGNIQGGGALQRTYVCSCSSQMVILAKRPK